MGGSVARAEHNYDHGESGQDCGQHDIWVSARIYARCYQQDSHRIFEWNPKGRVGSDRFVQAKPRCGAWLQQQHGSRQYDQCQWPGGLMTGKVSNSCCIVIVLNPKFNHSSWLVLVSKYWIFDMVYFDIDELFKGETCSSNNGWNVTTIVHKVEVCCNFTIMYDFSACLNSQERLYLNLW